MRVRRLPPGIVTRAREQVALWCALAAVGTCLAAVLVTIEPAGYRLSALVGIGKQDSLADLARTTDSHFAFDGGSNHYDGEYYYAIARDPFALGPEHRLIDRSAYRYGHPGFGWLGWILSAGRARAVPLALLLVVLACAGIAGGVASLLAGELGLSRWLGLVVALNPGIVFSATVLTSEAAGLAALLLGLLAWRRGKYLGAALALACACLCKETYVLAPLGIVIVELVRWLRGGSLAEAVRPLVRRLALVLATPLPFAAWYVYVWQRFDVFPPSEARDLTSAPIVGWVDALRQAAGARTGNFQAAQLGAVTVPLLIVIGLALLVASLRALEVDTELQAVFLLLALTVSTLNWWNLLYPKDLLRALAVQLVLLPFVYAPKEA